MKLKKLLSALVSGAMILGTLAAVPVFAEGEVVATITRSDNSTVDYTSYEGTTGVFANVQNGDTVTFHTEKVECAGKEFPSAADVTYTSDYDGGTLMYHGINNLTTMRGTTTFKGLKFDGNAISQYGSPVLSSLNIVIDGCTFNNAGGNCVYITAEINSLTVTGCTFTSPEGGAGGQYLVWPYNAHTINITNNKFTGNGTRGAIHLGNVTNTATVSKNTINSFERGVQVALSGGGSVNITENTFSDIKKYSDSQGRTAPIFIHSATDQVATTVNVNNNTITNSSAVVFGENDIKCISAFTGNTVDSADAGNLEDNSATYAAKIGDTKYATLADAVEAALNGGTVTLLRDAEGDGVVVPGGSDVTIDLNGFTYNVSGATVGSAGTETSGFQLLGNRGNGEYSRENNTKVTIKNGTLKATSPSCWILIQNYSDLTLDNVTLDGKSIPNSGGTWPYTLSNNFGSTTITGATNIIAKDGGTAFDCYNTSGSYKNGVSVTFDKGFTGKVTGPIEYTASTTATANSKISISGGTFTTNVADYVADGYYSKDNGDGTYTVLPAEAKVIDTAKTTGATVTLDNLHKNGNVNPADDATYQVVVETAPAADAAAANKFIEDSKKEGSTVVPDTNTSKAMFDISVVKTDSNGTKSEVNVTQQPVTLTLGETPTGTVRVYHVVNGVATEITPVTVVGNTVTFTAPSFSTYAVTYNTGAVDPDTITDKVGVVFSPVSEGSNQYYITLKSLDAAKKINRFMSTDLVFDNGCSTVDYDITPAANMTASVVSENGTSREYRFNMDGTNQSGASSEIGGGITIGTITFHGYGTLDFSVDEGYTSGHAINIVNTATATNNIVASYTLAGGLFVNDDVIENLASDEKGTIKNVTLKPETKELTVNIAYNNAIADNAAAYQDMTVTISGGDLTTPIVKHLGKTEYTLADNTYTVEIANELTQNVSYTVTVEGAGYRTARYTVNMATNKTLNFWNNVMDTAQVVEVNKPDSVVKTNFLAGDIVKDNQINIYDLSAVVSYFGKADLKTVEDAEADKYVKYDLNRDGKIDSKDVAYVLVSWNN